MTEQNRTSTIKAHITPSEREALNERAHRLGMTLSDYTRNVMVNFKLPNSAINARAIIELIKINADLARLGNLLKMAMNDDDFPVPVDTNLAPEALLQRVDEAQQLLKAKVKGL